MSTPAQPLVSCICASNSPVPLLQRSVRCFLHQTYPNKELVVVYTSDNVEAARYLKTLHDERIVRLELPAAMRLALGEKRNMAIEKSNGFYFCAWDDDDWYGDSRLEFQVASLRSTTFKSSVLTQVLVYDMQYGDAYLSGKRWAWEQTLLCEKSVTSDPELRYALLERGEDSVLVFNLREQDLLHSVTNPGLYIYIYHGSNTWHREHWENNIFAYGAKFNKPQSEMIAKILDGKFLHDEASALLQNVRL